MRKSAMSNLFDPSRRAGGPATVALTVSLAFLALPAGAAQVVTGNPGGACIPASAV